MSPAVFIDANVPVYAAGADHPYREPCGRILRMAADEPGHFLTDAEVLQEMAHRYLALGRWALGREVLRAFATAMQGRIEPVHAEDVLLAGRLADRHPGISARNLVHAAVMQRLGVWRVVSADRDFDRMRDVERLDPTRMAEWQGSIPDGGRG